MSNPYPQPQTFPQNFPQEQPKSGSGSGCWIAAGLGCLGVVVVTILACAGGVWYVQQNADKWVAGYARDALVFVIEASEIPEQEKTEVTAQIDRVVNAYKARKINRQDLEQIMNSFEDSPIFLLINVWGLETAHLDPSGLSAEEKEAGRLTINRAIRGMYEKKITAEQWHNAMPDSIHGSMDEELMEDEVMVDEDPPEDPAGKPQGNEPPGDEAPPPMGPAVTDEDVRKMLADLKQLADDAGIPNEPFNIDIGDEVKKAVDEGLKGKGL